MQFGLHRKNALTELAVQWNPASEEFVQIGLRMESCTDIIQPCEEYNDYTNKSVKTNEIVSWHCFPLRASAPTF